MSSLKTTHLVCLASAVIGGAVALGFHVASRRTDATAADGAGRSGTSARAQGGSMGSHRAGGLSTKSATRSGARLASPAASPLALQRVGGSPPASGPVGSEREWFAKAAKVELEANRELCRLQDLLDLSRDQQGRIFGLLARQSDHWAPGMTAGPRQGTTMGDASLAQNAQLLAELDPAQQEALANEELDRQAWWEEILPQLVAPQLNPGSNTSDGDLPATSAPEVKEFDGADTLIE